MQAKEIFKIFKRVALITLMSLAHLSNADINIDLDTTKKDVEVLLDDARQIISKVSSRKLGKDIKKIGTQSPVKIDKHLTAEDIRNLNNAIELYKKAYELGLARAARLAGTLYASFLQDKKNADIWLKKAIEAGDIEAFSVLAIFSTDFNQQLQYLKQGADKGDQSSAYFLANMYYSSNSREGFFKVFDRFKEICTDLGDSCDPVMKQEMQKMLSQLTEKSGDKI